MLEFVTHRSAYQLKEADPHSWALPRLYGGPKAALVQIQADEYGNGDPDRIHAHLFAEAMDELGLDARYGAYVDHLPGVTLATVNLMSLFGLHRRWRGAIVGHLALFEMESSVPNRRYASGLRRLGFGARATAFFDEHVTADAIHENIAAVDLAGGLARQQPALTGDILWGAAALVGARRQPARATCSCAWEEGVSSLRRRLPSEPAREPRRHRRVAAAPRAAALSRRVLIRRRSGRGSARPCATPSQNGRMRDLPQRHSAIVPSRPGSIDVAVLVFEAKRAADEQRAVAVARDTGLVHRVLVMPRQGRDANSAEVAAGDAGAGVAGHAGREVGVGQRMDDEGELTEPAAHLRDLDLVARCPARLAVRSSQTSFARVTGPGNWNWKWPRNSRQEPKCTCTP